MNHDVMIQAAVADTWQERLNPQHQHGASLVFAGYIAVMLLALVSILAVAHWDARHRVPRDQGH
jgi:hypothetical protein